MDKKVKLILAILLIVGTVLAILGSRGLTIKDAFGLLGMQ